MEREGNTTCQTAIWHAVLRFLKALFAFVVTDRKEFWKWKHLCHFCCRGGLFVLDGSGGIRHPAAGEHLVCCRCTGGLSRSLFRGFAGGADRLVRGDLCGTSDLHPSYRPPDFLVRHQGHQQSGDRQDRRRHSDGRPHTQHRTRPAGRGRTGSQFLQDGTVIPENTSVRIEAISGTKLLVSRLPQTEEQTVNN